MESLTCNRAAHVSSITMHYQEARSQYLKLQRNSDAMFSTGLVNIILPVERYFYALPCAWDKQENLNPHEKLNFRPSADSTLH